MSAVSPAELRIRHGRTDHAGEAIYWELAATGPDDDRPVVVLSHGAGGHHAVWFQQVPIIGRHFRVLTWDARGFGNSTNRSRTPSAEAAADDLAAVLDELDIATAHLVGQSMGGWHISAFAVAAPERVRSLVYADTVGGLWTDSLRSAFEEFSSGRTLAGTGGLGSHPALWEDTVVRDPALAFLYEQLGTLHDPPMGSLAITLRHRIDHDRIERIGAPVLFVAGAYDRIFPPRLLAASAALIGGARFVEIADAGHSPYFEQPVAWNEIVLEFLVDAEGGGAGTTT